MNMNPIITLTSVIEDPSNWTTTSATTTQKMPAISQNHQKFAAWRNGFRTAGPAKVSMPELSPG